MVKIFAGELETESLQQIQHTKIDWFSRWDCCYIHFIGQEFLSPASQEQKYPAQNPWLNGYLSV